MLVRSGFAGLSVILIAAAFTIGFLSVPGESARCGASGQVCCAGNTCNSGLFCNGDTCEGQTCTGATGTACCSWGCASGNVCVSGVCNTCGSNGAYCCAGNICNSPYSCLGGTCGIPSCGGSGKSCCDTGSACNFGLYCSSETCAACSTACGNGVIQAECGEVCDGSARSADFGTCASILPYYSNFRSYGRTGTMGCTSSCRRDVSTCNGYCGDNVKNGNEVCDGNDFGSASCWDRGYKHGSLQCGAGCNIISYGSCTSQCGDNVKETGEVCDGSDFGGANCWTLFGYGYGTPACNSCGNIGFGSCTNRCGDGTKERGEECDDGNTVTESCSYGQTSCTVCSSSCTSVAGATSYCGDGTKNGNEQCDDSNANTNDACTNSCTDARCGDGIIRTGVEACDDGNTVNGDGCSATCLTEGDATPVTYTDSCGTSGTTLTEWVCENGLAKQIPHNCPNGCRDGACLSAPSASTSSAAPAPAQIPIPVPAPVTPPIATPATLQPVTANVNVLGSYPRRVKITPQSSGISGIDNIRIYVNGVLKRTCTKTSTMPEMKVGTCYYQTPANLPLGSNNYEIKTRYLSSANLVSSGVVSFIVPLPVGTGAAVASSLDMNELMNSIFFPDKK